MALAHDSLEGSEDKAGLDVFDQMDAIEDVFRAAGIGAYRLPVSLDLRSFKDRLCGERPGLVFNLVESLDGSDRLQTVAPLVLEDWRIPFTGCGSAAMLLSNHKIKSKVRLAAAGLPVPGCAWLDAGGELRFLSGYEGAGEGGDWIVKALESHASMFLDDSSVLRGPARDDLAKKVSEASVRSGQAFFAERFVDGREFNLSVVETAEGEPEVLPPAEIRFDGLSPGRPRIVGYAAKWEERSEEYQATPRSFAFSTGDGALLSRLRELAVGAWRALDLSGYARVDFRVDAMGGPCILEVNTNPCLTPDAGLAAAAEQAGMSYADLVFRIAWAGLRRGGRVD